MLTARIFIHGLESSSQGTKAVFFRGRYPDMILPTFEGELQERMGTLQDLLSGRSAIRMVGSSFGGLMATLFAMREPSKLVRMVLLAPAIHRIEPRENGPIHVPTTIYHGTQDTVIPLDGVQRVAHGIFTHLDFHAVDDDHFLHRTFKTLDWDRLLA